MKSEEVFCTQCGEQGHLAGKCTNRQLMPRNLEPDIVAEADKIVKQARSKIKPKKEQVACPECVLLRGEIEILVNRLDGLSPHGRKPFDRVAYQRDYMRKLRGKK